MKYLATAIPLLIAFPAAAQHFTHRPAVDMTLWSAARIVRYNEIAETQSDPPVAILRIPRLNLEASVFRGSDAPTLDRGLGWIDYTAKPGTIGNTGIAGHRDSFFRPLKDIALDDEIELETSAGLQSFVVRSLSVVDPSHVEVLAPTPEPSLTLVTCYPFFTRGEAPERLIVRAVSRPLSDSTARQSSP